MKNTLLLSAFLLFVANSAAADDSETSSTAVEIVNRAATRLAETASAVAQKLAFTSAVPIALCGGLLVGSSFYRVKFLSALATQGLNIDSVTLVEEPAEGALRLAAQQRSISS